MTWALGGGIALAGGLGALAPSYLGAIERRLGRRSWLLINVLASRSSREAPGAAVTTDNPNPPLVTKTDTAVSVLLGLRQVFVEGAVHVSGTIAASTGYRKTSPSTNGMGLLSPEISQPDVSQSLGLEAGIAAERPLVEGLALRLSLRLARVSADWSKSHVAGANGETLERKSNGQSLALFADPSLALYFYF